MVLIALLTVVEAAQPSSFAMPGFNTVNVTQEQAGLYAEILSARFSELGLKVVTARDLQTMLGFERQRALLGCTETSCLTELVGALGVDDVLVGDLAQVDGAWLVTLKLLSARDASTRARFDGQAKSAAEVPALMGRAAEAIAAQLPGRPGAVGRGVSRAWAIIPGALAVASLSVGLWCQLSADQRLELVRDTDDPEVARRGAEEGKRFEAAGYALLATGAVASLAALAFLVFGGDGQAPAISLGPDHLVLGWAWRLP